MAQSTLMGLARGLALAGIVLGAGPAWADHACEEDIPLFSSVSSHDLAMDGRTKSFTVVARKRSLGCPAQRLELSVVGLPEQSVRVQSVQLPGYVANVIYVQPMPANEGDYEVTYTVTDELGNVGTVTLPIAIGGRTNNSAPRLSPVSDLRVRVGKRVVFTVVLTDRERNLVPSDETLTVEGLPDSARKDWVRVTTSQMACRITLRPGHEERGTYLVQIQGKDNLNATTIAQMKIDVNDGWSP